MDTKTNSKLYNLLTITPQGDHTFSNHKEKYLDAYLAQNLGHLPHREYSSMMPILKVDGSTSFGEYSIYVDGTGSFSANLYADVFIKPYCRSGMGHSAGLVGTVVIVLSYDTDFFDLNVLRERYLKFSEDEWHKDIYLGLAEALFLDEDMSEEPLHPKGCNCCALCPDNGYEDKGGSKTTEGGMISTVSLLENLIC